MRVIFLGIVVLFSACTIAPVTKESIRSNPNYSLKFSVNQPYQKVFDTLLKNTRACYSQIETNDQISVAGMRNNGLETANITVERLYGKKGRDVSLMMDLIAEGNSTHVNVYTSEWRTQRRVDVMKEWVEAGAKKCST